MGRGSVAFVALAVLLVLSAAPVGAIDSPPTPAGRPPGPEPALVPFSPNVLVNSGGTGYDFQVEPTMAINSSGRIFVGWKEAFTHNGGGQRVAFSYSTDAGGTWAPNVLMPLHTYGHQSDPWLTVTADDRVYFSRIEYDTTSTPGGIAITSTTDGAAWGTTVLLDDSPNFADKQTHANDAAGNLYVAWNSDSSSSYDVVFSRSDDGGASWTPKVRVPDPPNGALGAFVQVAPTGEVYVAWWSWANLNVWFDRSTDGGATWATDVRVNDILGSADWPLFSDPPVLPAMAVAANGTIYVVWNDYRNGRPGGTPNGNFDIMFSRSPDGGATWSPARRLNDDATTARQWMPDLALDPFGGIHVAWMDDRNAGHDVYYVNSTDGGSTWGPNVRVTTVSTPPSYTRPGDYLAIESDRDGHVYVVWTDGRGTNLDIYFARLQRTVWHAVDTAPSGLAIEVDGIPRAAPFSFECVVGTSYTVHAPSPQGSVGTRHVFWFWDDGGPQIHSVPCVEPALTWAYFRVEHELTVTTSPPGLDITLDGIPFTAPRSSWFPEGGQAWVGAPSLQVAGDTRYLFDSWSDGLADSHAVDVTRPMTLVATYRTEYRLAVTSPYGIAACDLGDCWYRPGERATFSVQPEIVYGPQGTRHLFAFWTGDASGTSPIGTIDSMDGPRTAIAVWRTEHFLNVSSPFGTPTGAGWHDEGSQISVGIEATVVAGGITYRFVEWVGDASGADETIVVTMDGPMSLTAVWEEVRPPANESSLGPYVWSLAIVIALLLFAIFLRRRRRDRGEEPPPAPPP